MLVSTNRLPVLALYPPGCGVSDERLAARTLLGHLASPLVRHALLLEHGYYTYFTYFTHYSSILSIPTMARHALLLEHGCERTHNDYFAGPNPNP